MELTALGVRLRSKHAEPQWVASDSLPLPLLRGNFCSADPRG